VVETKNLLRGRAYSLILPFSWYTFYLLLKSGV
jgi:hypothetical protein